MPPKAKRAEGKATATSAKPKAQGQKAKADAPKKASAAAASAVPEQAVAPVSSSAATAKGGVQNDYGKDERTAPMIYPPPADYLFELFLLLFVTSHLLLQNYNLNRMNLQTYNIPHIAFTLVFFTKRVAWKFLHPAYFMSQAKQGISGLGGFELHVNLVLRLLLWLGPGICLVKASYELLEQHGVQAFMFLLYPYLFYHSLFGGVNTNEWLLHRDKLDRDVTPVQRRAAMLLGFRQCWKSILYSSLEAGYYAAILPTRFLLNQHAIYDQWACIVLWFYVTANTASMLCSHLVSKSAHTLERQTRSIGCWGPSKTPAKNAREWSETEEYALDDVVRYRKKVYVATGYAKTTAEPGHLMSFVFHKLFYSPELIATNLVYLQIGLAASQLCGLLLARRWETMLGWTGMILF